MLSKTLRVMKFFLDSDYNHGVFLFCFVLLLHVIVLVLVLVIVKLTDVWEHGKDGSRVPAAKLAPHGGVEFVTLF